MPFELTEEQKDIKRGAKHWAEDKFNNKYSDNEIRDFEENHQFPKELYKEACKLGYCGTWIPEKYGGPGLGIQERIITIEALSSVDPFFGCLDSGHFGLETILKHGNEEQKEKWLPAAAKGEAIFASGTTEPEAGTDVTGITAKAKKQGDEWVINGTKEFNTNAGYADCNVILAITNPDAEKKHQRMSQILIETDREGYEAKELPKMGWGYLPCFEVHLDDVRVPEENLLGEQGKGFYQLMNFFNRSRLRLAARGIGYSQCALELAMKYAKERETFGKILTEYQDIKFHLAEMLKKTELARAITQKAAWRADKGKSARELSSIAKWYSADIANENVSRALLIHGGYGYTEDYRIERIYRDTKALQLVEGTAEAEKMTVSRSLLKSKS